MTTENGPGDSVTAETPTPDATGGLEEGTIEMVAPVREVTVFEDRALVVRRGTVALGAGTWTVVVSRSTPVVHDRSLRLMSPSPALKAGDCWVRRYVDQQLDPERFVRLEQELLSLRLRQRTLEDRGERLREEVRLRKRTLADLKARWEAAVPRGVDPHPIGEAVTAQFEELERLGEEIHHVAIEQKALEPRIKEVTERMVLARRPTGDFAADLAGRVEAEEAGTFELAWTYVVPCALWRPEHRAHLEPAGDGYRLEWNTMAVVWQRTGEVWRDVSLSCSTARPGRAAIPPLAGDDVLSVRRKTIQERREIVAELRDEAIQTTGEAARERAGELPGVDDGGEPLTWTLPGRVTVEPDGRPLRIPAFEWSAGATVTRSCLPERESRVFVVCTAHNPGPRAVLAGPVNLVREGGFIGRTDIGFVAPGETLRLSFGTRDDIRVHRDRRVKREESSFGARQTVTVTVDLAFSNLSDQPVDIEVTERVPVSEIEAVDVRLESGAPAQPDRDGMVCWTERLAPRGRTTRTIAARIVAPSRVDLPL